MDSPADRDHLAWRDHCCGQCGEGTGRRNHLRGAAGRRHRCPPGGPAPTTKISPPSASRRRARVYGAGVLPSGRPGAIRCTGYRRSRLRVATAIMHIASAGRGPRLAAAGAAVRARPSSWRGPGRSRWRPVRRCRRRLIRLRPALGRPGADPGRQQRTCHRPRDQQGDGWPAPVWHRHRLSAGGDPARWLLAGPAGWACLLSGWYWRARVCCGLRPGSTRLRGE